MGVCRSLFDPEVIAAMEEEDRNMNASKKDEEEDDYPLDEEVDGVTLREYLDQAQHYPWDGDDDDYGPTQENTSMLNPLTEMKGPPLIALAPHLELYQILNPLVAKTLAAWVPNEESDSSDSEPVVEEYSDEDGYESAQEEPVPPVPPEDDTISLPDALEAPEPPPNESALATEPDPIIPPPEAFQDPGPSRPIEEAAYSDSTGTWPGEDHSETSDEQGEGAVVPTRGARPPSERVVVRLGQNLRIIRYLDYTRPPPLAEEPSISEATWRGRLGLRTLTFSFMY